MSLQVFPPLSNPAHNEELESLHLSCWLVWLFTSLQAGREKVVKQPAPRVSQSETGLSIPFCSTPFMQDGDVNGPSLKRAISEIWTGQVHSLAINLLGKMAQVKHLATKKCETVKLGFPGSAPWHMQVLST